LLDPSQQHAVAEGLRSGCREAWAMLFTGYSHDIWRLAARQLGGDAAAVADVVQETFLAAAKSARSFDPQRGTLWSWLTGIAKRQVAQHWRQSIRAARVKHLAESGKLEIRTWLASEPNEPAGADITDMVRGTLAELSAEYAALLTAKYLDDLSLEQIAEHVGSSVEAVKSKLARARREFRTRLDRFSRQSTHP
jgi:RNA polymerase sigma-70 factor (ECF subfamily)